MSVSGASTGQGIITSTGIGSGIDIASMVSKLVAAEHDPASALITQQQADATSKVTALGTLQSSVSTFQTAVQALESSSQYLTPSASSSNSSAITATASSTAALGSHSISVSNIAQSQRIASSDFSSANAVIGTGTLIFSFGTIADSSGNPITASNGVYGTGATPPTAQPVFTPNANTSTTSVKITSQNDTLSGIASAINASNAGVTASVVNDGKGYRLVLSGNNTGADSSLRITVADNDGNSTDNSGLSQLSYDATAAAGSGQNLTEVQAAKNANLSVDGINITSDTNTPSTIINGVTLNLLSATSSPTTITVGSNVSSAMTAVQSFVTSYNSLTSSMQHLSNYNASDPTQNGALLGDPVIQQIQGQIASVLNGVLPGGAYTTLSQIGIGFDSSGNMTLDTNAFTNAFNANPASVAAVFGSYGVSNSAQLTYNSSTTTTKAGNYAVQITQPATQATVAAPGTVSSLNLSTTDNSFTVSVDGVMSGQIKLNQATYASNNALVAEMQSEINGDATLKAAGKSVVVTYDATNNQINLTSNTYGSASSVAILNASSDLSTAIGFGTTSTSTGMDVAGTIGGWHATGSGQKLTGTGNALGLAVTVTGTSTGTVGNISYNVGFASQLDATLTQILSKTGGIQAETDGYNSQLTDLQKQQTELNQKMADLQQNYLAEFNAMDATVATLQQTGTFLTQQLSALSKNSTS
ncbi:MAG: flagellar filament capping protein FliD [Burkholderiales bacterium]|nr:flagellar filament capping protein FliD [Burkholderiales bacterium]